MLIPSYSYMNMTEWNSRPLAQVEALLCHCQFQKLLVTGPQTEVISKACISLVRLLHRVTPHPPPSHDNWVPNLTLSIVLPPHPISTMDIQNPRRALAVSLQSDQEHLRRIIYGTTSTNCLPLLWQSSLPYTHLVFLFALQQAVLVQRSLEEEIVLT